jgi:hypothetical protein
MPSRWPATSLHPLAVTRAILGLAVLTAEPIAAQTLSVSASPAALHITTAVVGSAPTGVADNATTYTTSAPGAQARQITAQLDSNMPLNTILTIKLNAVVAGGAVTAGTLTLTTTAQSVVTNITNNLPAAATITYTFSATAAAGVIAPSSRTVTFTLLPYP